MVELPIITPPFEALTIDWPASSTGGGVGNACSTAPLLEGSAYVLPSTTACDEPTETVWPATLASLPGAIVELPTIRPPFVALTADWPATSNGDGDGEAGGACTIAPALGASA